MCIQTSRQVPTWCTKTKSLIAGLLLMCTMMAATLMAAPAHASTTFVVNSQQGDGPDATTADGLCKTSSGECTLRAAIQQANFTPGADTINFNATGGVSLRPSTPMPVISDAVTINGYSQPGSSPNTLSTGTNALTQVDLIGENLPSGSGLDIRANNTVVRGMLIGRFKGTGISISGDNNKVEGNYIGTEPIGVDDIGNGSDGVLITTGSDNNTVGGTSPAARNAISANDQNGLNISAGSGNKVLGNLIGTQTDGITPLGNTRSGVRIVEGSNNTVGDGTASGANTIAFNGTPNSGTGGVEIQEAGQGGNANGNRVSRNSIFANEGLGIVLGNNLFQTPNDPGDKDTGPNGLQNFPVLTSAKNVTTTTVTGKLNSNPNKTYNVQFFSNPSGGDEGRVFVGQKNVTTDGSGNASFTFKTASKVAKGRTITATASDPAGDTSEFSAPKTVGLTTGSDLSLDTAKISGPSGLAKSPTAHFKFYSLSPEANFECSLDGGDYYPCSSPENINKLSDGRHTFFARAMDEQSNVDQSPLAWAWAVEKYR
jgi:hypothetical protein